MTISIPTEDLVQTLEQRVRAYEENIAGLLNNMGEEAGAAKKRRRECQQVEARIECLRTGEHCRETTRKPPKYFFGR
jgi:hypothetical protein